MVFLKQRKVILQTLHFLQQQKNNQDSWSISWRLGKVLAELIYIYSPKNILEIGTSIGFSTLHMASELLDDAQITSVEINDMRFSQAKKTISSCLIDSHVTLILGNFYDLLEKLGKNAPFDFLFLDALQPQYLEVIELCLEKNLLISGSVVVCDNILSHSYMDDFEKKVSLLAKTVRRIDLDSGFLIIEF